MRFNTLPYKKLSGKLKHRTTGNPDQPFGPTELKHPYGVLSDVQKNTQKELNKLDGVWGDVKTAFKTFDTDGDGVIRLGEFKCAMRAISEKHRLQLSGKCWCVCGGGWTRLGGGWGEVMVWAGSSGLMLHFVIHI